MKIKIVFILSILLIAFLTSCNKSADYNPKKTLSKNQINTLKSDLVRYYAHLAKKSNHQDKFDSKYNSHYDNEVKKYDLLYYYKNPENNYEYFALTRIAPSFNIKKVAIVGKYHKQGNEITDYEEKFRTWKMSPEELETKTKEMFQTYINNGDLSKYETKNSQPEFWIEFPDDKTKYDKEKRQWIMENTP
ncbi:MAG: hypothetical protein Q4G16_00910 [Cruoricaptor ignavus]|nr:hypothetical protein [Cruoricaptor ignavus]